ncbi:hypothetical protein [Streptomyces tropicalis]|uniref:Uncharacterized protein n=1 Tax=Streptomyces tropicalis TaxID=3034234 RepID=A0ABT6A683_9ACTN|nr:hypothetical protein [Streptomyces tropicalis]MDF3300144.1 hypothetical protein [Streptomyces tropicalis]
MRPATIQSILDELKPKCTQTDEQMVPIATAMVRLLQEHGVNDESEYSALIHLNQSIPAGTPKMDCQSIAADYVTLREGANT